MRTPKILVVEPDREIARQVTNSLKSLGYEVAAAEDGRTAVQQARALRPDLGLLDLHLPGSMDGPGAGDVLHSELDIPVVFIDAFADSHEWDPRRPANSYGYVTRPFTDGALGSVIELALHRHRIERALGLSERRFRLLFDQNPAGVVVETADGRILECNQALAGLLGYASSEELRGQPASALFHDPTDGLARRQRISAGETIRNEEVRLQHREGHAVWVVDHAVLVPDPTTGRGQILRTVLDITERKHIEQGLEQLAYCDPLTGLPNRRMLQVRADQTLAEAHRRGERAAVMFLDLVGFKKVNDELGHQVGDEVIVRVARRLESCLRRTDSAARFGGDEFVVILSSVGDEAGAERAARRILDQIGARLEVGGAALEVTARTGVALYPEQAEDLGGLMKLADNALTRAKAIGGSVIVFADTPERSLSPR